ncbi:unnamed protein product [Nesidiocoris tenuis]|uniref:Small ribosomal subunit protein mS26 n=1 Tax=Nesidiocoris tenuis TaxID=355587 RepID=A0A6H5GHA2_9HEMI|nr:unnamed protein product [Nesidiocoris tenuis]
MLRRACASISEIGVSPFSLTAIRWKRTKPRWLPTAKTKVFRVPERKKFPADEDDENKRLFNNYRTLMRSLKHHFAERTVAMSTGEEVLAEIARKEEEAAQEAIRINDEWNAEIAKKRAFVLAQEKEREALEILEAVQKAKAAALEMKMKADEIVRQEKERAKHYITPENIDQAIAQALETVVDPEFAIDLKGNIYEGRRTRTPTSAAPQPTPPDDDGTPEEEKMAASA